MKDLINKLILAQCLHHTLALTTKKTDNSKNIEELLGILSRGLITFNPANGFINSNKCACSSYTCRAVDNYWLGRSLGALGTRVDQLDQLEYTALGSGSHITPLVVLDVEDVTLLFQLAL